MSSLKTNSASLMNIFDSCPDPRKCRIKHHLTDVIAIVVFGTICGEDSWDGLEDWAIDKRALLDQYLSLKQGVPSADTLRRVMERLDPKAFLQAFIFWSEELTKRLPGQICIDGKSFNSCNKGKGNLHLVNAWCEQNRITLGSIASEKKGKEIPCIKELLDNLSLMPGDIISIDAIGCQKELVKKIQSKKADYLIALKANQGKLRDEVENFFNQAQSAPKYAPCECFTYNEKKKSREDTHEIWVSRELDWLPQKKEWKALNSIIMVKRCWLSKGKKKEEIRYYISSLLEGAEKLGSRIRRHWSIENEYHWHLDVSFGEEASLISSKANRNLRVAREIALKFLRRESSKKMGLKRKMRRCARSDDYFKKVLLVENI